jgi:hypothetical protein
MSEPQAPVVASNELFGSWFTGTPPHTKEGTVADYFLCLRIDSEVPCVLIYQHEEGTWTSGGGDTQRVLAWAHIPPKPNPVVRGAMESRTSPPRCSHS